MNRLAYKKQKNCCVSVMLQNEKKLYGSLNVNHITDNKYFWRLAKTNFSNKITSNNRLTLWEGGKIISDAEKVSNIFKI